MLKNRGVEDILITMDGLHHRQRCTIFASQLFSRFCHLHQNIQKSINHGVFQHWLLILNIQNRLENLFIQQMPSKDSIVSCEKVTKSKTVFPTDDSLLKMLYSATTRRRD